MPTGPGKYDSVTTLVREMTGAACVVVIVIGGHHGDGFDQQIDPQRVSNWGGLKRLLVDVLRAVAAMIDRDMPDSEGPPS